MRLGLIGDTHGNLGALEVSLHSCRQAGCDIILHCGDFLGAHDAQDNRDHENIELLQAPDVRVIPGNVERYVCDWGTARWDATLAQRRRRPDSPEWFLPYIPTHQARQRPEDLQWLRSLPEELFIDVARQGDVYVCHGMPGHCFSSIWDTIPYYGAPPAGAAFSPAFTPDEVQGALQRVRGVDLILCGHAPGPLVMTTALPGDRSALVIRSPDDGAGYVLLTHRPRQRPARFGFSEWEITIGAAEVPAS
jgi:predicted phosphodiesterase